MKIIITIEAGNDEIAELARILGVLSESTRVQLPPQPKRLKDTPPAHNLTAHHLRIMRGGR